MSFRWRGDEFLSELKSNIENVLHKCAMDLKRESVKEAPIKTGALRNSAYVYKTKDFERQIGYDRNNARGILKKYAIVQHERLDFKHPNGGKAKFLEDPYNRNKDKYTEAIAQAVKEAADAVKGH